MDVRPVMTVKSEKIFLRKMALSFWNYKSQEKTQNRYWRDVDKERDINEIFKCILFQIVFLSISQKIEPNRVEYIFPIPQLQFNFNGLYLQIK